MQQAADFGDESRALDALLGTLAPQDWARPTRFKGWTVEDILRHLHVWNLAQDRALGDPEGFAADAAGIADAVVSGRMREAEQVRFPARGPALRDAWIAQAGAMAARWAAVDPGARIPWVGPAMSARSAMTARQMETWAHGQAIWDLAGRARPEHDRIRNIVVLGVNTFAWSHRVQGLPVPDALPFLRLAAPSGAVWTFGEPSAPDRIDGPAVAFAQVVTQTRNLADTPLAVTGPVATRWMQAAQCFAGPREAPPPPGTRGPG
jgi:uncharacterized protein (TIGR03084 family)